ncbi:ROK family transcriptional regulator [Deinococcus taeanensis]|uniref:ROK family transcriptional regulator n=1 Tax=Deinococcus taeanensis TaxID=2737050 RepID=UPI001CDCA6EE|nr:ROK family transcriptional regulator [Deinococcus taeanensis]UBV42329.1 ROK family transcriptional regulator [Deinococcus taeanensis]
MSAPPTSGDQPYLKQLNRSAVLNLLRRHPGLSRADLALHTGLTKVTVGSVVTALLQAGWLHEGDTQHGGVGRPGRPLQLNPTQHVLLGAEIGVLGVRALATTLDGTVLARTDLRAPTGTPDQAAATLADLLRDLLAHPAVRARETLGLGVALPGPVNPQGTRLLYAPNLGWEDVPFLERLAPHLPGLPGVRLLDNEANAAAFGEVYRHPAPEPALLAYISLGSGVGAGLVRSEGGVPEVLRGAHGLAGEIGHTVAQPGGLYCHCGNRGCVETLLGGWAIRAALALNVHEPLDETLAPRLREAAVQVTLSRAGEALGLLLVNLHHTLNPSDIVIGGALTRLGGPLIDTALDFYHAHRRRPGAPTVRVIVRPDSVDRPAAGAAAQVLARVIASLPEGRA